MALPCHSRDIAEVVAALAEQVRRLEGARRPVAEGVISSGCGPLDRLLPERGLRRGTLVEWLGGPGSGAGLLALIAAGQAAVGGGALVVVDRRRLFYPPAAVRLGIDLEKLIVVRPECEMDHAWALDQVLRTRGVAAVWCEPAEQDDHTLRRWQLAAESSGVLGLLVRDPRARDEPSWAELRLLVEPIAQPHDGTPGQSPRGQPTARRERRVRVTLLRSRTARPAERSSGTSANVQPIAKKPIAKKIACSSDGTRDMKRALCIWLPNWPLQRLAATRAELSSRAVVLYQWHAARSARVVAYCPALAAAAAGPWDDDPRHTAGIRAGMPLAEATALADFAHGGAREESKRTKLQQTKSQAAEPLHLEMHDPLADRLALADLAEWCQRFSPSVGFDQEKENEKEEGDKGQQPEGLLLDASSLGSLFGGERALARRVAREFREQGFTARVAIADTPGAAWAMAHFADLEMIGESRDAEAILSAIGVPVVVPPGQTWAAIAPLPVEALRLPEETCGLLAELGLRRIEQVAALPRATLLSRFGPGVLEKLDRATGAAAEAITARALPDVCQFEWPLEHATARREMIDFALMELIARACNALARQRRGMLRLECRFECGPGRGGQSRPWLTLPRDPRCPAPKTAQNWDSPRRSSDRFFIVGLYRPSANARHVSELARLKLETLRFREPVSAIRVTVLEMDGLEFRQQEIFVDEQSRQREAPRAVAALVDRLSNRLGPQAVLRPWLLASAQPEFACQYRPLSSLTTRRGARKNRRTTRGKGHGGASGQPMIAGDRPLFLEPRPVPLSVVSVAPEGPPVKFRLAGRDERIVRAWGPERIETGWWRARCVRRDYYQVETSGGGRFWMFRQLNSGKWFLHGEFA